MKRVVVALLIATMNSPDARAADAPRSPTSPQVPAPSVVQDGSVVRRMGAAGRVLGPGRDRISVIDTVSDPAGTAAPAWIEPALEATSCAVPGRDCGGSVVAGSPIKSWLFYRPTTAHALPWLRPHPYVGPVTGQFHCSPTACPQCAAAPACAPATACGKGLIGGRGCRDGLCVPPADDAFTGYKFAQPMAPSVVGRAGPVVTSTSYKPGVAPTGMSAPTAPRTSTVIESFKRTLSKP